MKSFIGIFLILTVSSSLSAQSIVGTWQLIKQTNCIEENLSADTDDSQSLVDEMKTMSTGTPQVVTFKEKMVGEESTRLLTKRKAANTRNFLYKFDGESLMILDKKSQTITDSFIVDKFSSDSLIVSTASRPCETKIFIRVKQ